MKQRLLLALLMLFSSVGFMKVDAQISITLPKTKEPEDVTITFTSSEKKFKPTTSSDIGSYPMMGKTEPKVSQDGATATYKLKTKADDKTDLSLSNNINPAWGNITLTLNGKVSKFKVSNEKTNNLQSSIISLSFTNNGELSELILGGATNAYTTEGLPNLKELSCAGNKLNYIPVKPTDMEASKYNIGTQILDVTLSGTTTNSKEGVTLPVSDLTVTGAKVFSSLKGYNITKAKDKVGNAVTVKKVADNKFVFTKGDIFFDGELTFDVEVTDTNYLGVIISGVKTTISAPMFTLKKDNLKFDSKQGTITSNINFDGSNTVKKGDKIVLTPAPNDGYAFDKFTSYKGVSEPTLDGNAYTFIVLGDVDPVIEAAFKAKGATVTYNTPDAAQGTLRVTKAENNELVASGNTVPVGTKLLITAKAKDGYKVGDVTFKKADKSGTLTSEPAEGKKEVSEKTWTYEVTIDGLDVQAAFTALTKALTTTTPNIKVTDTKGKEYTWKENKFDIPVGTELVFTLNPGASKVVSSVIINSESYEVTKLQDGTFTWKGFVMPEQDSKMVVTTSSLFDLKNSVQLVSTSLTYTGDSLAVDFTVNKNVDKTSFKVEYKVSGAADNTYTEKPFTNCGPTYKARITRPADGVYAAYKGEFEYTIDQAQLIVEAPTVEYKDGKFVFAGGAAYFMNGDKKVYVDGKFVALNDGGSPLSEDEMADYNDKTEVKVNYSFDNANVKGVDNFKLSYGDAVESATIKSVGTNALTFSLKSTASTATPSALLADDAKVSVGSTIMFSWDEIEGLPSENYAVYQADANGEKLSDDLKSTGYTIQETDKDQTLYFLLEVEDERGKLNLSAAAVSYIKKGFIYGDSWNLQLSADSDKELYFVDEENNKVSETKAYENISITYYKNGVEIAEVIDAGEYQVEISRPACDKYTEFKSEKISFTVSPAEIPVATVVVASSATAVGLGQPLSTSKITGVSDIAGKFVWNEDETVILTADGQHKVKFVPESSNYKAKELKVLTVTVSTQPLLTVDCDSEQGRVEIKDTENNYYYDGDLIVTDESKPATKAIKAKTLTITAVPADGFVFESFTFIKKGVKRTVKTNPCTQSVSDASLDVKANFKEKSAEIVYHKINISTSGVGFAVSTTSGSVKDGDSFNFSMSAHPSDYSRIVVKDNNGKSYSVTSLGACTIDNVQEDLQLTVSLSNPTKYNVTLPAEYKDSEGNLMGTANFSGNTYYGGTITLTAVPKEGYKFVGWLNAGTTSTATTVQVTVTSNMTISARFESDGTIDPNTECIIRTPYDEDLTGVSINKQGVNVVKIGSDFEFTVAAYKDDLARVKVTVDGAELKPTTGNKYVISKVKKNTEVKVTLDNPTRIKVVIEKETKNAKGYVMGHVDVDVVDFGTYYPDSTCYYNTKLRLAAYPESGVEFKNWSDVTSNTDLIREITVTDNVTIKPVFEGTPTGIEDIMAASIATGKGCVWVRGIANADVTIVSIAGRVQARQRISGDTRIDVPAGIYVVVLESGSDVKRAKVIVK